jgi:ArsR family transcriptional regulator
MGAHLNYRSIVRSAVTEHPLKVVDDGADSSVSCASLLKVLADETRLAVVELLLTGPQHVGAMIASLQVEPSLLSHHLKVLREAGLVTAQREGKQMRYALAKHVEGKRRGRAIDLGCCLIAFD